MIPFSRIGLSDDLFRKLPIVVTVIGVVIAVLTLSNCANPFAPKLGELSTDFGSLLTAQQTPDETLTNFQFAYTFKDSLVYRDLLDDDFVFVWRDHDNNTFVSWGKEDDVRTTLGLFNTFTAIDLQWNTTN